MSKYDTRLMTTMYLPKRLVRWLRLRAEQQGLHPHDYIAKISGLPDDFLTEMDPQTKFAEDPLEHKRLRDELRQTIITILKEQGGQKKYREIIKLIPARMQIPPDWLERDGPYPTKLHKYAALERKWLTKQGVVLPYKLGGGKHGFGVWKLAEGDPS